MCRIIPANLLTDIEGSLLKVGFLLSYLLMKFSKDQLKLAQALLKLCYKVNKSFEFGYFYRKHNSFKGTLAPKEEAELLQFLIDKKWINVKYETFNITRIEITEIGREFVRDFDGSVDKYYKKEKSKKVINVFKNVGIVLGALIAFYTFIKLIYNDHFKPTEIPVEKVTPVIKPISTTKPENTVILK